MTKALKKSHKLSVAKCLIKVKKKKKTMQIQCTINLAQRWIKKDRDQSK